MKYGEALRILFEAMYKDRSDVNTTYTAPNLTDAVKTMPAKWKAELMKDFGSIRRAIEIDILSCPHPESARVIPYPECEECGACFARRRMELEDQDPNSWNERKIWTDWKVW